MQHVSNKHDGHPNPMFTKCTHEEIGSERWVKIGREKVYLYHTPVRKVGNLQFHVIQLAHIVHCSPSIRHTSPTPNILYACTLNMSFYSGCTWTIVTLH